MSGMFNNTCWISNQYVATVKCFTARNIQEQKLDYMKTWAEDVTATKLTEIALLE